MGENFEENSTDIKNDVNKIIAQNKRKEPPFAPPDYGCQKNSAGTERKARNLPQDVPGDYNRKYLDMVCVDPMGNLIHPDRITERFPVLLERFGMEKIRFHDLRHSCASMLIANHASLKEVQMWLGHSTITTTADIYGHLDESAKNKIGDAMQKLLCPDEAGDD